MFGYAVLRANFNHDAPSYLDNFSRFILDVLASRRPEALDEASVGRAVRDAFGLTIPDRVVGTLLKRALKSGGARSDDNVHFAIGPSSEAGLSDLQAEIARFETEQVALRVAFLNFAHEHYADRADLIAADPDLHVKLFIEKHAAPLLRRAERGRTTELGWTDLAGAEYLVGAFVLYLERTNPIVFQYIVDAVKGAILLGVLELDGPGLARKIRDLVLVLDTPVLLKALGYHGEVPQLAVRQTLTLARSVGIETVCFEHTVKELDGVLESVIPVLRYRGRGRDNLRAVDTYFLDNGMAAADVALLQDSLAADLADLGVAQLENPGGYYRHGLSEDALESTLKEYLPTQRETTRGYDVQSLSAVHRLRRGKSPATFEESKYVLVTDNVGICIASRHIEEARGWSLAMLDRDVAALLWVRSPATAEDLPRDHLLATVYAGMRPSAHLWMRYVEEIERLEIAGSVNPDEALVLRTRPEARAVLMDTTLGEAADVSPESVEVVLERLKSQYEAPLKESLAKTESEKERVLREAEGIRAAAAASASQSAAEVDSLRARIEGLESTHARQERTLREKSERRANAYLKGLVVAIVLVLAGLAAANEFLPSGGPDVPGWLRTAAGLGAVTLVILAGIQGVFGGSLREWLHPVRNQIAQRLERRARRRAGLLDAGQLGSGGSG